LKTIGIIGGMSWNFTVEYYRILNETAAQRWHQVYNGSSLKGIISSKSKKCILNIMTNLGMSGAKGIILGCTELSLMIKQEDIYLPLFDTTVIHATSAVEKALIE
jgi:aspartate racemase